MTALHFAQYLKAAFVNRWNLMVFGAALVFGMLSGRFDILGPLVIAGELGYVGLLASQPKFQAYVDAQLAKALRQETTVDSGESLRRIMAGLPMDALRRFHDLRSRCLELRQIAADLKEPGQADAGGLDNVQLAGLDRLLWIYLRLLYTKNSLERFLDKASTREIEADIARVQEQLKGLTDKDAKLTSVGEIKDDVQRQKAQKTLEDNLQTCRDRLANYEKARDNCQLVALEIDRLDSKIRTLSELAVNRHEPDFISTQVDQVATSMVQAERTMNDLQFATGLRDLNEAVPTLLEADAGPPAARAVVTNSGARGGRRG